MTNPLVREYQLSDQLLDRLLAADETRRRWLVSDLVLAVDGGNSRPTSRS